MRGYKIVLLPTCATFSCINSTLTRGFSHAAGATFDHPMQLYNHRVSSGILRNDVLQRKVIEDLEDLHKDVHNYTPQPRPGTGFFSKLFLNNKKKKFQKDEAKKFSSAPNGIYMFGSVGCGKTMLMDMFYDTCHIEKKQRVHFHQFMLDVHQRIHEVKKTIPRETNVRKSTPYDPIKPVAQEISEETWLLCFDEFQVTDIADAMILKRLFSELWKFGVIVIATSNRAPDDLYKNGLQRIHFLPFIPMLKANCDIINLDSGIDYRRQTMPAEGKVFFVSRDCDSKYEMDLAYEELVSKEKAAEGPRHLRVLSRDLTLPKTCGTIADCTFSELCAKPLGAVDYLEICKHFDTVLIRDIPHMTLERKVEARRFITLIDTFYDHGMRVIASAEEPVDDLFATGSLTDADAHFARVLYGDLDIQRGDENETASLFTGEEELFAFERVKSRLTEMQTEEYWKKRQEVKTSRSKSRKGQDKITESIAS